MGAPLLTDIIRTIFFSFYLITIGFLPIIWKFQGDLKQIYRFIFENSHRNLSKNLVLGSIIGAWLGAIPIPLDWDRWWQRWPITCLVSSTIGVFLSLIFSYVPIISKTDVE